MKRLTEYTIPETGFSVVPQEKYKRILMEEKPSVEKIYNRLKKIEDILGDEYDMDRLQELVEGDRDGRCVMLPCKVGTPIYYWVDKGTKYQTLFQKKFCLEDANLIGRKYFLTKEDAEAALKARE